MVHVVILGGGFGGVYAAKRLLRNPAVQVTLIHPQEYLLYTPMLHEVATGGLSAACVTECIAPALHSTRFRHLQTEARRVDFSRKVIETATGNVPYDYCIMAIGTRPNFFGTAGAAQHALPIKTLEDAKRIRQALIQSARSSTAQSYVVVGGGATGVEMMGEIVQYIRELRRDGESQFTLIHAKDTLVPQAHPSIRRKIAKRLKRMGVDIRYERSVQAVGARSVALADGTEIVASVVVWTAGVQPNQLPTLPVVVDQYGKIVVDAQLRIRGVQQAYAIGDCAAVTDSTGKTIPDLAQSAVVEGRWAAENILAELAGKPPKQFTFRQKGFLVSVGKGYGVAEIGPLRFSGFFAWWLMRTIYLMKMLDTARKFKIAWQWIIRLFRKRDAQLL